MPSAGSEPDRPQPCDPHLGFSRRLKAVGIGGAAALILAMPAQALGADGHARFGWQTYAGVTTFPVFESVDRDGVREQHSTREYSAGTHASVDYTKPVAEWLCRHHADVVQVVATNEKPAWSRDFECSAF